MNHEPGAGLTARKPPPQIGQRVERLVRVERTRGRAEAEAMTWSAQTHCTTWGKTFNTCLSMWWSVSTGNCSTGLQIMNLIMIMKNSHLNSSPLLISNPSRLIINTLPSLWVGSVNDPLLQCYKTCVCVCEKENLCTMYTTNMLPV